MHRRTALAAVASALAPVAGCLGARDRGGSTTTTAGSGDALAAAAAASALWPMGGHDAAASSHNPAVSARDRPGDPAWTYEMAPGASAEAREDVYATGPAVDAERAYLGVEDYREIPGTPTLRAVDRSDGSEAWRVEMPYRHVAPPALAPGPGGDPTVFAASGQDESNTGPGHGEVWALDPASGERRWRWTVPRKLVRAVVAAGGRVYVANDSYGKAAVHALDAETGEESWRFRTGDVLHHAPTVAGGRAYASSGREELAALDAETGDVAWRTPARADATRPVVDRHRRLVLVGNAVGLEAFDATSGDRAWLFRASSRDTPERDLRGVIGDPVVAPDTVYAATADTSPFYGGDPGRLYALDPASGDVRWRTDHWRPACSPVGAAGDVVCRLASNGSTSLVCLSPDGDAVWTATTDRDPAAVAANGRLLALGDATLASLRVA